MGFGVKLLVVSAVVAALAAVAVVFLIPPPPIKPAPQGPVAAYYVSNDIEGVQVGPEEEGPEEELSPGYVLVQPTHVALNPADGKVLKMALWCRPGKTACGLGLEGSGVVRKSASAAFPVGSRVFFGHRGTARSRLLRVHESKMGAVPKHWSLQSAAGMGVIFTTALKGFRKCQSSGEPALVVGGSSSTGVAALQILRHEARYSRIVASCGDVDKCRRAGATDVISRHNETLGAGLRRLGVRSLSRVYEAVHEPSDAAWRVAERLRAECFAAIDPGVDMTDPLVSQVAQIGTLLWRMLSRAVLHYVRAGPRYDLYINDMDQPDLVELQRLMQADAVSPPQLVEFPFTTQGMRDALAHLHDLKPGKPVLKIATAAKQQ